MSRNLSFRDIQRIPGFQIPQAQLVHPDMDEMLEPVFVAFGFDTGRPITYHAAKHRDLTGMVDVGVYAIGELDKKATWYTSHPICPDIEKMMCSNCMATLAELAKLQRGTRNPIMSAHPYPPSQYEEDYEAVSQEIAAIEQDIAEKRAAMRVHETQGMMPFRTFIQFRKNFLHQTKND